MWVWPKSFNPVCLHVLICKEAWRCLFCGVVGNDGDSKNEWPPDSDQDRQSHNWYHPSHSHSRAITAHSPSAHQSFVSNALCPQLPFWSFYLYSPYYSLVHSYAKPGPWTSSMVLTVRNAESQTLPRICESESTLQHISGDSCAYRSWRSTALFHSPPVITICNFCPLIHDIW